MKNFTESETMFENADFIRIMESDAKHIQSYENDVRYIVAARIETAYKNCIVVRENDALVGAHGLSFAPASRTHKKVFGPASREECEKWRAANCRSECSE